MPAQTQQPVPAPVPAPASGPGLRRTLNVWQAVGL